MDMRLLAAWRSAVLEASMVFVGAYNWWCVKPIEGGREKEEAMEVALI
jgi:hypothetical protein